MESGGPAITFIMGRQNICVMNFNDLRIIS